MANTVGSRREFLRAAGAGVAAGYSHAALRGQQARRPNILFLCTDYQAGEDGPSLGSPFADMPALDRLCRNGVTFTRHYCTAPICMPARYTLYTGQYPHSHGKWGNTDGWIPEGSPVLMEILGEAGYYRLGIGKMHMDPWDRMGGFSRRITADRKGNVERDKLYQDDYAKFLAGYGLTRWDYLKLQYQSDPPHVYDWPYPVECHIDHFVGSQARKVVESGELNDRQPWFLWVSFNGPHNPWDPPAEYSRPYKEMKLPPPRTYPGELRRKPIGNTRHRYNYTKEVTDYMDRYPDRAEAYIQRIRAGHFGNLTFIDRQVQGLLEALERKGLLEETIVIYSADHGSMLGDHGNIHKGLLYERSARVPFVVHCPARFQPRRSTALTSHVDVMPTILSLAGIDIPAAVEGRDLNPLFTGAQEKIQDEVFIEIQRNYGIVTDRMKMFVYPNGEGELYDLKVDPNELENRYEDPDYRQAKAKLQQRLVEFQPEVAPRFENGPPQRRKERSEYHFRQGDVQDQGRRPFPPRQSGRAVHVRAVLSPSDGPLEGTFFASEEWFRDWIVKDPQNGYALYVRDGKAAMGVRIWGNDTIIQAAWNLPDKEVMVEGLLARDGTMTLKVKGETVASGKAPGCLPVRQARLDCLAPSVHVGVGHKWGWPIGAYRPDRDFRGTIKEVVLTLK